jgi:hypothetical protein
MEAGIAPKGAARRRSAEEIAAEMERLVVILGSMRQGLVEFAAAATRDIEHHSFRGYRRFRQKLVEHAALLTLLRERLAARPDAAFAARVDEEEVRAAEVAIRATLNFIFALSAIPSLPLGARETFLDELQALAAARKLLTRPDLEVALADGVLDDIETAQLVLEEVAERAPKMLDLDADEETA